MYIGNIWAWKYILYKYKQKLDGWMDGWGTKKIEIWLEKYPSGIDIQVIAGYIKNGVTGTRGIDNVESLSK